MEYLLLKNCWRSFSKNIASDITDDQSKEYGEFIAFDWWYGCFGH